MTLIQSLTIAVLLFLHSSSAAKLDFLTRNLALVNSGLVPRAERRDIMIEELRKSGASGICLQEVWYSSDLNEIVSQLSSEYPYSFSKLHTPNMYRNKASLEPFAKSQEPLCDSDAITVIVTCIINSCEVIENTYELLACVFANCGDELAALSVQCRSCLFLSGALENLAQCTTPSDLNLNLGGLLYLSKKKIYEGVYITYDTNATEGVDETSLNDLKGYMAMYVKGINGVVVCTHLSENLTGIPFYEPALPQYSTFADRNLGQMNQLAMALIGQTNVILMGSLGTGPKYKNRINAKFPRSYNVLKQATPKFKRSSVKKCTYCAENTVLDHILARGHKLKSSKRRYTNDTLTDHAGMVGTVRTFNG